jgi:hypothetical protein
VINVYTEHNTPINPGLPLINLGTKGKPVYYPAELCYVIPGQPVKTKLLPAEQDAMIKFACRKPAENATSIITSGRELLALKDNKLLVSRLWFSYMCQ